MVTPDVKIAMTVVAGSIVATIATVLAQLGGSDPWGAPMPLLGLAHACTPWSLPHVCLTNSIVQCPGSSTS